MLQLDAFSAKTLERNNIWVHSLLHVLVFSQKSTLEQLKLILYLHRYAKLGLLFRLRLLLAQTFSILYSLYQRISVLQFAWFIHDVAILKYSLLYVYKRKPWNGSGRFHQLLFTLHAQFYFILNIKQKEKCKKKTAPKALITITSLMFIFFFRIHVYVQLNARGYFLPRN